VTVGPFLKWAGGKRQLLPKILERLPAQINTYFEPFLGGGAVFFALAAEGRFKRAVLSDSNAELINAWSCVKECVGNLITLLRVHERRHSEEYFYRVRAQRPRHPFKRAARFIYLNKTCFNGLYRVNASGRFNAPFGDYKRPNVVREDALLEAAATLGSRVRPVELVCTDFANLRGYPRRGDAVYFDPPYVPLSKTSSFAAYTRIGFTLDDQARLAETFTGLARRGVDVVLSNSDTPLARRIYAEHAIHRVSGRRAINSVGAKRGHVGEILVTDRVRNE